MSQVEGILAERLQRGEWQEVIPSERRLCEELRVSRKTLRAALEALCRKGFLRSSSTRLRLITTPPQQTAARFRSRKIFLIGSAPIPSAEQSQTMVIEAARTHVREAGFDLDIAISPRFALHHCTGTVAKLVKQTPVACWILWSVQAETQRWFVERGLPALALGSCLPGIALPSIDMDYRASIQHAVDLLLARGHRRIVLFIQKSAVAGYRLTEESFLSAFQRAGQRDADPRITRHDGTIKAICSALDALGAAKFRPTALVVNDAFHVITVFGHLSRLGLQVPADLSVISHGDDPCLDYVVPRLARYSVDPVGLGRKLARLAIQIAEGHSSRLRRIRIMPRFISGESVAPPRD